jgi:putative intracellular protease/amidase
MIREEEDDTTQEMRAFVLLELKQETTKLIEKIESANVPAGFYDGYDMVVFGGGAWATYHQNHWDALEKAIKNKTSKYE